MSIYVGWEVSPEKWHMVTVSIIGIGHRLRCTCLISCSVWSSCNALYFRNDFVTFIGLWLLDNSFTKQNGNTTILKGISAPTFDDINVRQRQMLILDVLSGGENEYTTARRVIIESKATEKTKKRYQHWLARFTTKWLSYEVSTTGGTLSLEVGGTRRILWSDISNNSSHSNWEPPDIMQTRALIYYTHEDTEPHDWRAVQTLKGKCEDSEEGETLLMYLFEIPQPVVSMYIENIWKRTCSACRGSACLH